MCRVRVQALDHLTTCWYKSCVYRFCIVLEKVTFIYLSKPSKPFPGRKHEKQMCLENYTIYKHQICTRVLLMTCGFQRYPNIAKTATCVVMRQQKSELLILNLQRQSAQSSSENCNELWSGGILGHCIDSGISPEMGRHRQ